MSTKPEIVLTQITTSTGKTIDREIKRHAFHGDQPVVRVKRKWRLIEQREGVWHLTPTVLPDRAYCPQPTVAVPAGVPMAAMLGGPFVPAQPTQPAGVSPLLAAYAALCAANPQAATQPEVMRAFGIA